MGTRAGVLKRRVLKKAVLKKRRVGERTDERMWNSTATHLSTHHRSIVVASIFSVKLSATETALLDDVGGNSSVPQRSWRADRPPVRRGETAKVPRNAANRKRIASNAGLFYQGREPPGTSREFSRRLRQRRNPRNVNWRSRCPGYPAAARQFRGFRRLGQIRPRSRRRRTLCPAVIGKKGGRGSRRAAAGDGAHPQQSCLHSQEFKIAPLPKSNGGSAGTSPSLALHFSPMR
jgi:hypothetical protein